MTSQSDQIQALVTDIDGILQKTTPRLPWVMSGESTQQRQILERIRNFLVSLQRSTTESQIGSGNVRPDLLAHDIYYQPSPTPYTVDPALAGGSEGNAQEALQMAVQDINYLRSSLMQTVQADLENLRQQREYLVREIRQLEAQRQNYAMAQPPAVQQQVLAEFMQTLMARMDTLSQQVVQVTGKPAGQSLPQGTPTQVSLDQHLVNLDSTLTAVFESLQRNVNAYEESLSQGIDKMHNLGQQSEVMFAALFNLLAQRLGQASAYLQSADLTELQPVIGSQQSMKAAEQADETPITLQNQPADSSSDTSSQIPLDPTSISVAFPYAGAELEQATVAEESPTPAISNSSVDAAIDSWLRTAGASETSGSDVSELTDAELALADLDLSDLDLNQVDPEEVDALLSLEAAATAADSLPARTDTNLPLASATAAEPEDTSDIDAALKLLEQLTTELQDQEDMAVTAADAHIDHVLSTTSPGSDDVASAISSDARDELDEFYESLFGNNAIASDVAGESDETVDELNEVEPSESPVESAEVAIDAVDLPQTLEEITLDPEQEHALEAALPLEATPPLEPTPALETPLPVEATAAQEPQIVAEVVPAATDEISTLNDLFEESPITEAAPSTSASLPTELETVSQHDIHPVTEPEPTSYLAIEDQEQFILASPEENLLPESEPENATGLELWPDEATLSHLNEDLSSLEQGRSPNVTAAASAEIDASPPDLAVTSEPPPWLEQNDLTLRPTSDLVDPALMDAPSEKSSASSTIEDNVFSLEGVDDLFADFADEPPAPPPAGDADVLASFSLDELGDLFIDNPPASETPIPPPEATQFTEPTPGPVEVNDLFADTPTPVTTPVPPPEVTSEVAIPLTLEEIDAVFADLPEVTSDTPEPAQQQVDSVFADLPEASIPAIDLENASVNQLTGFTLQQMDDLLIEMPIANAATSPESADSDLKMILVETPAPFTIAQLDDVYVEVPTVEEAYLSTAAAPEPASPTQSPLSPSNSDV